MEYQKVITYLFETLPAFTQLGSAAFKPGLDNIRQLCEGMGNPQDQLRVIHVAGTNGKGSVSSMLASVLMECGYRVGLNTSPHMLDFRERIRVDGEMIPEEEVILFVETYKSLIDRVGASFFEVSTAMAFWYFAKAGTDVVILEVGMGGRFDATNIIADPVLCIITHIGLDHQQFLGESLGEIAAEKAGIIKAGSTVVIAEIEEETQPVFERIAAEKGAELLFAEEVVNLERKSRTWSSQTFEDEGAAKYTLKYLGSYQQQNLGAVLCACRVLRQKGWKVPQSDIETGIALTVDNTSLTGRSFVYSEEPLILLDIGHNSSGVRRAIQDILEMAAGQPLHFVWGMMRDKDIAHILELLPEGQSYYWVAANSPRALSAEDLAAAAQNFGGESYPSVGVGLAAALQAVQDGEGLIYVGGSNYVVSEALDFLEKNGPKPK